jgi:hypothetical protein
MHVARTALVAASVLALTAACATPAGPASPNPSASSNASASPSSSASSTATPTPTGEEITVRGTVEEGVEAGCLVLRADGGKSYLLLGADPTVVTAGARVEVVGDLRVDLMSYCMQGTPMVVHRATRI